MALPTFSIEQADRPRDNPALAALSACFAVLCATSMDAMMKGMSTRYPAHELMFLRPSSPCRSSRSSPGGKADHGY